MFRIGVDTGGTFTDCIIINSESGGLKRFKTPSTPEDYSKGVMEALKLAAEDYGVDLHSFLKDVELIIHGTTIATNLILSRAGQDVGLITTKGFRDIIEQWWKEERRYDMKYPPPDPPAPRWLRREIDERIDFSGKIITELNSDDVEKAIELFKKNNVSSIAISLIFSPINPVHEIMVADIFKAKYPESHVYLSSEILPQLREYERTMATVLNAYVAPYSSKYLRDIESQLKKLDYQKELLIMQSNSGVASVETINKIPIRLALSGPASGPLAGLYFSELIDEENIITIDMGGTSFDTCLVKEKAIPTATDGYIGRFRLALPTIDIHSLGAGGGSIAWVDSGGVLYVGPKSAGAKPGPACYGYGGNEPTVTDANLILGYINPDYFLGGRMKLHYELAKGAILKLSHQLNMSLEETANGIFNVVNNNMIDGIYNVSVKRGYDPKDFILVAAGGAGPVHALKLAEIAGISKVIIPRIASAFCAFGMAISNLRHDYVKPYISPTKKADLNIVNSLFEKMEAKGQELLFNEGIKDIEFQRSIDMRYIGQIWEIETAIPYFKLSESNINEVEELFHQKHELHYGHSDKNSDIEMVHLRVKAIGKVTPLKLTETKDLFAKTLVEARKKDRKAYFEQFGTFIETQIYNGELLAPGHKVEGPAIIEEPDTTLVLFPNWICEIGKLNNYIIKTKGGGDN